MKVRRPSVDALLKTPKATITAFDREVQARRDAAVRQVRDAAAAEALAFLGAEPTDAAGPVKDAEQGEAEAAEAATP